MNIIEAIKDPHLFRPAFRDLETWRVAMVLLRALFALPMDDAERSTYAKHTGREEAPTTPFRELWLVAGRRSGKSFLLAVIATYLSVFFDYRAFLAPGERAVVQVYAADRNQALVIFRYVRGLLGLSPMLERLIEGETKESVSLTTRVDVEVTTASFRTLRGRTLVAALCDELAFWQADGSNPDAEILAAIRPAMATIPTALLAVASSPYARAGSLFEADRDFYGKSDPAVLVWKSETRAMNPTIPQALVDREIVRDPARGASEWLGVFRSDIESYVSREAVDACVVPGRFELPRVDGITYHGFVDPSGGSNDSMTLAVAHAEEGRRVLDCVREVRPPFSPEAVVLEFCEVLKSYGCHSVVGDRYAGEWPRERFREAGITYEPSAKPKSDLYRDLLPALNSGKAELLDHERLVKQLTALERRTARGGKDSIDHGPGGHDDLVNAAAGALSLCGESASAQGFFFLDMDDDDDGPADPIERFADGW